MKGWIIRAKNQIEQSDNDKNKLIRMYKENIQALQETINSVRSLFL